MKMVKKKQRRTRSKFIKIDMKIQFTLTITKHALDQLVSRMVTEGIGDWGLIMATTKPRQKELFRLDTTYTLPIQVVDIETGIIYNITRAIILRAIRDSLIDFPYALDTRAGYNLAVHKLTREDMDEIIQLAVFKKIKYGFVG